MKSQIDLAPPLSTLLFHSLALMVIIMMIMMDMRVLMIIMMTPPLSKYMFGKISRSLGKILDRSDTLNINRTLFILSGHFFDHPDTFQITPMVKTPFISFRQIIRTFCRSSGHFPGHDHLLTRSQRADLALVVS